jgi:hypothetical protein
MSKDIASSVRRAFGAKRLQSAWALLGSPQDGERAAAMEGVSRILEAEGLSLGDVLTALLTIPASPYRKSARAQAEDLFSHADRREGVVSEKVVTISGRDVPARINGRIEILDDRVTKKGAELVVAVLAFDTRYDPLVARSEMAMAALKIAAMRGSLCQVLVEPATKARQMPVIEKLSMGIAF